MWNFLFDDQYTNNMLTCGYDVIDAGSLLSSNAIPGPAEKRAVVKLDGGHVGGNGGGTGRGYVASVEVDAVRWVVEGPSEVDLGRIGVNLAGYVRLLLFRYPVDLRLVGLARRRDCKTGIFMKTLFLASISRVYFQRSLYRRGGANFILSLARFFFPLVPLLAFSPPPPPTAAAAVGLAWLDRLPEGRLSRSRSSPPRE